MPTLIACASGMPRPSVAAPASNAAAWSWSRFSAGTLQSRKVSAPDTPCRHGLSCARTSTPAVPAGTSTTPRAGGPVIMCAQAQIDVALVARERDMAAVIVEKPRQESVALRLGHRLVEQHEGDPGEWVVNGTKDCGAK